MCCKHSTLRLSVRKHRYIVERTTCPSVHLPLRRVFEAFEKYCRVDNGYVGTADVTRVPPAHDETMQSFFVAVRISVTPVHRLLAFG